MALIKQTYICEAHYPRQIGSSQWLSSERLQISYNIYKHEKILSTAAEPGLNLIFTHGNGMCKEVWEYMIERCFEYLGSILRTVVSIDCANQNDSYQLNKEKLGWTYVWSDGGRDIIKVARYLNLSENTILIGHSMGAVGCLYATYFEPGMFDSVIAIDPVSLHIDDVISKKLMNRIHESLIDNFEDMEHYKNYMLRKNFTKTFHPRIQNDLINSSFITNLDGTVSMKTPAIQQLVCYFSGNFTLMHEQQLRLYSMIECEVLHVAGTATTLTHPETVPTVRRWMKNCTPIDIEGGAHLVPFEKPDETFEPIKVFLEKRYSDVRKNWKRIERRKAMSVEEKMRYNRESIRNLLKPNATLDVKPRI